jgi:hypothetical protein
VVLRRLEDPRERELEDRVQRVRRRDGCADRDSRADQRARRAR